MFLLQKSPLDASLFNLVYMDSPGSSLSQTSLYQNVLESATILDAFEDSYNKILVDYENFGYKIEDYGHFEHTIKPFYQALRHGLGFDWIINYFVGEIIRYFPYCHFSKFSGTDPFVTSHIKDEVFKFEMGDLEAKFARLLDEIFVYNDTSVFRRLVNDSGEEDFLEGIGWAKENNKLDDYRIVEETLYRTNYLVALGMMLTDGVGLIKREFWHNALEKIKPTPVEVPVSDTILDVVGLVKSKILVGNNDDEKTIESVSTDWPMVAVCGGKYKAFAFGNLDRTTAKWHLLENGIRVIGDFENPLPDASTYFKISPMSVEIDATIEPTVKLGNTEEFISVSKFSMVEIASGIQNLQIKYPFNSAETSIVEISAITGCVIKDQAVELDINGVGSTQILVEGNNISFTVGRKNSPLPFANFINKEAKKSEIEWL